MVVAESRPQGLRWSLIWIAVIGLGGWHSADALAETVGAAEILSPAPVEWALHSDACAPPEDGISVACGDYGTFYIGMSSTKNCAEVVGNEAPPAYIRSKAISDVASEEKTANRLLAQDSMPCAGGSCFGPPGGASGDEPWIAVIDWNDWHGWSTGWSAISISGLPAHLYALDGEDLTTYLGPSVGDAHVLARLCEVAEAVDHQGVVPPTVVNMSFGRYFAEGLDARASTTCDSSNLSCQLGGLFDHLTRSGVALTSAAGNHGQTQFPAVYESVLAVGSIDLAHLNANQTVVASWETTSAAQALIPGYGVCLEVGGEGYERRTLWPAPPGSSYSSSLFAGWLAHSLLAWPSIDPLAVNWNLAWSESAGCYVLSEDGPAHCNEAADRLLARVLGTSKETCWTATSKNFLEADSLGIPPQHGVTNTLPSLSEWVEIEHTPAPESDPCVPCVADGFEPVEWFQTPEGPQMRTADPDLDHDLKLDLSASSAIDSALTLQELHLRVSDDFYLLLDRSQPTDVARLDALAHGEADGLVLRDARQLFEPHQQPSLLFVLCDNGSSSANNCFWSSIPVLAFN